MAEPDVRCLLAGFRLVLFFGPVPHGFAQTGLVRLERTAAGPRAVTRLCPSSLVYRSPKRAPAQ
jgi:hypothetical protein